MAKLTPDSKVDGSQIYTGNVELNTSVAGSTSPDLYYLYKYSNGTLRWEAVPAALEPNIEFSTVAPTPTPTPTPTPAPTFTPFTNQTTTTGSEALPPSTLGYTVTYELVGSGGYGGLAGSPYDKPGITPGPLGPYATYPAVNYPTPTAYQYHAGGSPGGGGGGGKR